MIADARCPKLVGRKRELQFLRERCKDATLGRGSMVFVSGEAGIGKTRLTAQLVKEAELFAMVPVTAYCLEHARSPLGPLADIVRALHAADDSILVAARGVRTILARLVPEIDPDAAPIGESGGARAQYAAIAEMFGRFGDRRPVIIVLEDADWADLSTTEFIKYFAAKVGALRVLVLVLVRHFGDHAPAVNSALAQLRRGPSVHTLELGPLAPADMDEFVQTAIGLRGLPHAAVRNIRYLADGNPLFAEELLSAALNDPEQPGLPASIREVFIERIRQLDAEDRDILTEAAVMGRRFDPFFLAQLTQRPIERIWLALRHARALHLIIEDDERVDGALFRHALVRETLYGSILAAEARRLHRRIAGALEAFERRDEHLAALAYHSWAARDHPAASTYNEAAGDEAMRNLATNEASLFYERALTSCTSDEARLASLQRKLATAFSASGLTGRAIEMFVRAHDHFKRTGDVRSMAEVCMLLGREHLARADGDAAFAWRVAAYEAAGPGCDDSLAFEATSHLALAHAKRGDPVTAQTYLQRADRFCGRRSPAAQCNVYDAAAIVDVMAGRAHEAFERYEAGGLAAAADGERTYAVRAIGNLAELALPLGYVSVAERAALRCLELADGLLESMYRIYALLGAAYVSAVTGSLDLARRRLAVAEDVAAGVDSPRLNSQFLIAALSIAQHVDDSALVERYADERAIDDAFASREPGWIGPVVNAFAELYGRTGRTPEAQRLIHRALALIPDILYSPELALTAAHIGVEADIEPARRLLDAWAAIAAGDAGRAYRDLFEAYALRRAGRSPIGHARCAAQGFERLGLPFLAARAYECADERAAAVQMYLQVGSATNIARLSAPRAAGSGSQEQLTKREREVFSLVADSRSNREIADVMRISERTVESHIRSILSKVNGRSRHDLIKLAQTRHLSVIRG